MQPLSGNQRPDLRTRLMEMSLVLRLPREMRLCGCSSNVPRLPLLVEVLQNPHVWLTFHKVQNPWCLTVNFSHPHGSFLYKIRWPDPQNRFSLPGEGC